MIKVALAGNPNVGKSLIFNNLTGSRQKVGNWPGKTVEKKEGVLKYDGENIYVVDLPGTYSLAAYSVEELIARDYIIKEKPDVVVVVVDASNLERNLYLVLQILELGVKTIIALNKMDLVEVSNLHVDPIKLERLLGVPVIPTIAPKKIGMDELCRKIIEIASVERQIVKVRYGSDFEEAVKKLLRLVENDPALKEYNSRWLALKLLEGDDEVFKLVKECVMGKEILEKVKRIRKDLESKYGDLEIALIDERYRVIKNIVREVIKGEKALTASDALDQAFLDKYLGIPVFISVLWVIFQFTFIVSAPFSSMIGDFFAVLSEALVGVTGIEHLDHLLFGEYGLVNGIGMILSFVPLIMVLYFALSLFEDFGYMARVAFLMDKAMKKLGLTGRTIIPMILGFGCNIAGVYGTRAIPEESDRLIAIVTNPLMLCSARLVAFSVIVAAFWGRWGGSVLLSLYLLGIGLAILIALILKKTVLRGRVSPFVMELPPYQMPSLKSATIYMWVRGSLFFKKAGTVILFGLILLGLLTTIDARTFSFTNDVESSLVAALGRALQPIFAPLEWDWKLVVAIIFGFIAKEIVIGATAMLYGVPEKEFEVFIARQYDPVTMYAYMVFVLIYVPCIATLAAVKHETASWKWTLFTLVYEVALAYALSLLVFFIGKTVFPGV